MKNKEIIQRILAYHPQIPDYQGCDGYKAGDPEAECTGVAVALVPTVSVIRRAARKNCSLLIVHEPIYYQTPDYADWKGSFPNAVQEQKKQLLQETGLTVWRDHDHMHAHQPDSIFSGVIRCLGWEEYYHPELAGDAAFLQPFVLPETTVADLGRYLIEKLGLHGLRYLGNPQQTVERVALAGHLYPNSFFPDCLGEDGCYRDYAMSLMEAMEKADIQVLIPGEIIEWTVLSYIRDAVDLGKIRACLNPGHFNLEELGMKDFAQVLAKLLKQKVPVCYLPTEDQWNFL